MRKPIHLGETQRENLDALGMSAAELARRIEVPVNSITQILKCQNRRHGVAAWAFLRHFNRVLAQSADKL